MLGWTQPGLNAGTVTGLCLCPLNLGAEQCLRSVTLAFVTSQVSTWAILRKVAEFSPIHPPCSLHASSGCPMPLTMTDRQTPCLGCTASAGPSLTTLRDSSLQHVILRKVTTTSGAHFIPPKQPKLAVAPARQQQSLPRGQDLLGRPGWRAGHVRAGGCLGVKVSGDRGGQLCSTLTASAGLAPSGGTSWRA